MECRYGGGAELAVEPAIIQNEEIYTKILQGQWE
jgi:hypothetical protein